MKLINKNTTGKATIRGDVAKHPIGTKGIVILNDSRYETEILDVISSHTNEYLDDYYVCQIDNKKRWILISEFEPN